jgi:hypothetical protein
MSLSRDFIQVVADGGRWQQMALPYRIPISVSRINSRGYEHWPRPKESTGAATGHTTAVFTVFAILYATENAGLFGPICGPRLNSAETFGANLLGLSISESRN